MIQLKCVLGTGKHEVHGVKGYDLNVNHFLQEATLFINQKEK